MEAAQPGAAVLQPAGALEPDYTFKVGPGRSPLHSCALLPPRAGTRHRRRRRRRRPAACPPLPASRLLACPAPLPCPQILLVGDSGVGKSSLLLRFATGGFEEVRPLPPLAAACDDAQPPAPPQLTRRRRRLPPRAPPRSWCPR